jgi:hypothetical protein
MAPGSAAFACLFDVRQAARVVASDVDGGDRSEIACLIASLDSAPDTTVYQEIYLGV